MSYSMESAMFRLREIFEPALPKAPETTGRLDYSDEIDALTEVIGPEGIATFRTELKEQGYELNFIPRQFLQQGDARAEHSVFRIQRVA